MKTALIVPAYRPTDDMIPMLERFVETEGFDIVVVNDGSGEAYDSIFAKVSEPCKLLIHPQNRGKGAALKTAMTYIMSELPDCDVAVTADADGQHKYEDILRIAQIARNEKNHLVLGSRAFDGDVPFRSRFGNGITRFVFKLASGVKVYDTQTGLRAFDRESMGKFAEVPGERYEYEINMLLYAAQEGIKIKEDTIETVYIDDNSASSFNPLKDSIKIYKCIFRYIGKRLSCFLKFIAASMTGFAVDYIMLILFGFIFASLEHDTGVLLSVCAARVISATVNFILNKRIVFKSKHKWWKELWQYALLVVFVLVVKSGLMYLATTESLLNWPAWIADIPVEVLLFIMNYFIQKKLIFKKRA